MNLFRCGNRACYDIIPSPRVATTEDGGTNGGLATSYRVMIGLGKSTAVALDGSGNRGMIVGCSTGTRAFSVSEAGDNGVSFDGSFTTIAGTPACNGVDRLHVFVSGDDVRTLSTSNGVSVAGLIFPDGPCGGIAMGKGNGCRVCSVGWPRRLEARSVEWLFLDILLVWRYGVGND